MAKRKFYNLANPLEAQNFRFRVDALLQKQCVVELKEKKPPRTFKQNRYLHAILELFGSEFGLTLQEVKEVYFKRTCNPDLFIVEGKRSKSGARPRYLRSSKDLTTDEMTLAIDRFRNWSAKEAEFYIPSPEERDKLLLMEMEADKARGYL